MTITINQLQQSQAPIDLLNTEHALIMVQGQARILNEYVTEHGWKDINFSSPQDFKMRYLPAKIFVNKKPIPLPVYWLDSDRRRQYEGICFDPSAVPTHPPSFYNVWHGWWVEPKKGKWNRFERHIREVICSNDPVLFEYVISWMASIIQRPEKKLITCLVLRGPRGVGKSVFCRTYGKLFGKHFLNISDPNKVTGRFNAHLKHNLLLFCDEAFWSKGLKKAEGVLKELITEKWRMVEPKYVNASLLPNLSNIIMASNNDQVIPAGPKERRFVMLDVSDKHIMDNKKWFDPMFKELENGGYGAMMYFLKNYKIKVDLNRAPKTEGLFDQVERSFESVESWWYEALCNGYIEELKPWPEWERKETLYKRYREHSKSSERVPLNIFGKTLKKICDAADAKRTLDSGRVTGYRLLTLDRARKVFEQYVGQQIKWPE